jgi:molybdopterin/thiamine biosynthesis adenylyltransferase
MNEERYSRHLGLFGAEGQRRIAEAKVAIVGLGGLGAHVVQQLAYLGVRDFLLIDGDVVSVSNLNRLIGATEADIAATKVDIAARQIEAVQPGAIAVSEPRHFDPVEHDGLLREREVLFGCLDEDSARLELVRAASGWALPYIDLASDVTSEGEYGGRIVFAKDGERCLSCLGELDQHALARAQMGESQLSADDAIYGVDRDLLAETGPSVVSINGVVASLAVTELLVWLTGLREPRGYITYRGDLAMVGSRSDPERDYCHYCMTVWGSNTAT